MPADIQRTDNNLAVDIPKDRYNTANRHRETAARDAAALLLNSSGVTLPPARQPVPLPDNGGLRILFNMKGM